MQEQRVGRRSPLLKVVIVGMSLPLLAIGVSALVEADTLASLFGIPTDGAASRAYVRAAGLRDVVMGLWLLAMLAAGATRRQFAAVTAALIVLAAGDAISVYSHAGSDAGVPLAGHLVGVVALGLIAVWLWRGEG